MVLYSSNNRSRGSRGITSPAVTEKIETSFKQKDIHCKQIMDIERYYAAFPALEKTVPACWKKASDSILKPAQTELSADGHRQQEQSVPPDDVVVRTVKAPIQQKHPPKSKNFLSASYTNNNHHYSVVGGNKNVKAKKPSHKRNALEHKRKAKSVKTKEHKPWKQLEDVGDFIVQPKKTGTSEQSAGTGEASGGWLTLEPHELASMLANENMLTRRGSMLSEETVNSESSLIWLTGDTLWKESAASTSDWQMMETAIDTTRAVDSAEEKRKEPADTEDLVIGEDGSDNLLLSSWSEDYQQVEEMLSSLQLYSEDCEEGSSKLTQWKNPLAYTLSMEKMEAAQRLATEFSYGLHTCSHCEQSYEIILESELASAAPRPRSHLFSHLDPTLDFDWTKYHPPPWSTLAQEPPESDNVESKQMTGFCDCDFCRRRIWQQTCQWCSTPI